jgi:hypothetical protein
MRQLNNVRRQIGSRANITFSSLKPEASGRVVSFVCIVNFVAATVIAAAYDAIKRTVVWRQTSGIVTKRGRCLDTTELAAVEVYEVIKPVWTGIFILSNARQLRAPFETA